MLLREQWTASNKANVILVENPSDIKGNPIPDVKKLPILLEIFSKNTVPKIKVHD